MRRSTCATRSPARSGARRRGRCRAERTSRPLGRSSCCRASPATSTPSPGWSRSSPSCVAPDDPVKVAVLTLTNTSTATRHLSVFGYVEWCLGPPRAGERRFVVTELDETTGAILARNAYNTEFDGRVAFWHASERAAVVHLRSRGVRRPQPHAEPPGRAVSRSTERARAAPGSIRAERCSSTCGSSRDESRRVAFVLGQGRDRAHGNRARDALRLRRSGRGGARPRRRACGTTRSARFRSARRTIRSI